MTATNDITGDKIKSKPNSDKYRENIEKMVWNHNKPKKKKS